MGMYADADMSAPPAMSSIIERTSVQSSLSHPIDFLGVVTPHRHRPQLIGLLIGVFLHRISRFALFIVPDKSSHASVSGCHVLDVSPSSSHSRLSRVDILGVSFPTVPDRILASASDRHVLDV